MKIKEKYNISKRFKSQYSKGINRLHKFNNSFRRLIGILNKKREKLYKRNCNKFGKVKGKDRNL